MSGNTRKLRAQLKELQEKNDVQDKKLKKKLAQQEKKLKKMYALLEASDLSKFKIGQMYILLRLGHIASPSSSISGLCTIVTAIPDVSDSSSEEDKSEEVFKESQEINPSIGKVMVH